MLLSWRIFFFFFLSFSQKYKISKNYQRSPRAIKGDFRALGKLVKISGVQAMLSSVLLVTGTNNERNRQTQLIKMCF